MTALHDWARICAPEGTSGSVSVSDAGGSTPKGTPNEHTPKPAARAAANNKLRGSLLQYTRLGC